MSYINKKNFENIEKVYFIYMERPGTLLYKKNLITIIKNFPSKYEKTFLATIKKHVKIKNKI